MMKKRLTGWRAEAYAQRHSGMVDVYRTPTEAERTFIHYSDEYVQRLLRSDDPHLVYIWAVVVWRLEFFYLDSGESMIPDSSRSRFFTTAEEAQRAATVICADLDIGFQVVEVMP